MINITRLFILSIFVTVTLSTIQNSYVTSTYDIQFNTTYTSLEIHQQDALLFAFLQFNNLTEIAQYDKASGTLLNKYYLDCDKFIQRTFSVGNIFYIASLNATIFGNHSISNVPYTEYTVIGGYYIDNGTLVETFFQVITFSVLAIQYSSDGYLLIGGGSYSLGAQIMKMDTEGNEIWTRTFPGTGALIFHLAVDQSNLIYAAGISSLSFNGIPDMTQYNEFWLLKTDSNGNNNVTTILGTNSYTNYPSKLIILNGTLYLVTSVEGYSLLQDNVTVASWTSPGSTDIAVLKFSLSFQFQGIKVIGTQNYDTPSAATVDEDGNILVFSLNGAAIPNTEGVGYTNIAKFSQNLELHYWYQLNFGSAYSIIAELNSSTYYLMAQGPNSLVSLTDNCMAPTYCNYTQGTTGDTTDSSTGTTTTSGSTQGTTTSPHNTPDSQEKNQNTTIIIASAVGGGAVLLGISALIAFILVRRKHRGKSANEMELASSPTSPGGHETEYKDLPDIIHSLGSRPGSKKMSKLSEVIDMDDIQIENKLGGGYFGEVYKGLWHGTTPVALKRLKDASMLTEFLREAEVLQNLSMPYIVRFFGIWTDKEGCRYIVTEFMAQGSLKDFLDRYENTLKVTDLILMAKDIAAGMKFMASKDFIHRDLAARNILVKEEEGRFVAKVADFGLARVTSTNYYTKGGAIPIRWSSPEVLTKEKFSTKSDVWAYAVVLWEMFEFGKLPYMGKSNEEVCHLILQGHLLPQPAVCPPEVWTLMQKCWKIDPQERPSFEEVYSMISDVARNFGIYSPAQPLKVEEPKPFRVSHYGKPGLGEDLASATYHQNQTYDSKSSEDESDDSVEEEIVQDDNYNTK